jgi:hypothetical protein
MNVKQVTPGKKYLLSIPEHIVRYNGRAETFPVTNKEVYFVMVADDYDHECDCCGKKTMNGFVFANEYHPENDNKTWDSGTWFVGGSSCLKKYVTEI